MLIFKGWGAARTAKSTNVMFHHIKDVTLYICGPALCLLQTPQAYSFIQRVDLRLHSRYNKIKKKLKGSRKM